MGQQAKQLVEEESKQMKQKMKVKEKGEKEIQEVNALLQECTQALKLEEKQKENKSKQNTAASAAIGAITDKNNGIDHAKSKKEAKKPQAPIPSTKTEPNKHMGARS